MKPIFFTTIFLGLFLHSGQIVFSEDTAPTEEVKPAVTYIIPIKGVFERGLLYVVRRGINEAVKEDASAIIFDMDTPGGMVNVMEEIVRLLIDLPEGITTYTFVNKDALSAGALMAMATDHIYMSPGSRIGASAVVTITGDIEEGDMKEKIISSTMALVSSAAEHKGHNPKIVEAMMRKESEFKIGEKVICEAGKLLTLTDIDAGQLVGEGDEQKPLLSSGTVKNIDELRAAIGIENSPVKELVITPAEKIARYIELFSILFLAGGILGLYIEFKTPGFGVPGIAGIILLAIFFWGHNVAGLSNLLEIVLFLLGVFLLIIEIFFIPGFGITGIGGLLLIIVSIGMAMMQHIPGGSWVPPSSHIEYAAKTISLTMFLSAVGMMLLTRFLPDTPIFNRITISSASNGKITLKAVENNEIAEGHQGVAVTDLRPSGTAEFHGKRFDVVSNGNFIPKTSNIVITEIHGNRIVVDPA